MEDVVLGVVGLVSGSLHWGIANAMPITVGALLGSSLGHSALGLVGDILGRAKEVVESVGSSVFGKK